MTVSIKHVDWTLTKLGRLASMTGGCTPSRDVSTYWDGDIPWISAKDMHDRVLVDSEDHVSLTALSDSSLSIIAPDSVLVVVRGMILAKRVPVAINAVPVTINQDMKALRPRAGVLPHYLLYLLEGYGPQLMSVVDSAAHGTRCLRTEQWKSVEVLLPPEREQAPLVAYLDAETARIDALINRKNRFIDLLLEKRTALISRVVTKGLNPKAEMKDSGVQFIGAVPASWDVAPLYARYEVTLGKMLDAKQITGEHLAPYLRNADVQWDYVNVGGLDVMDFDAQARRKFALQPGDLLVCEGGEVGRTAIWRGELEECFYQKAVHRLRPRSHRADLPRFFYYVMLASAKAERFTVGSNVATIGHLTATQLRHHRFAFPPTREQHSIVEFLDAETAKIDTLVSKTRTSVELLREHRTALISAAVTGQLDIPVPETTEEVA